MAVSRQEMQRRLTKLEADVPNLMAAYPDPDDFMCEFAARAYSIIDATRVTEDAWAFNEIGRILQKFELRN
jgi:hypothetical protein